jgi:hypothetical protein
VRRTTKGPFHLVSARIGGVVGHASAGVEWWIKFMGRTPLSTLVGFNASHHDSDIRADLPKSAPWT